MLVAATSAVSLALGVVLRGFGSVASNEGEVFADASFWMPMALAMLVTLPMAVWDLIRFTNRLVGPIYRLRKAIARLSAGEPFEPLVFRKGDFWHDLADEYNALAERFGDDASPAQLSPAELQVEASTSRESVASGAPS